MHCCVRFCHIVSSELFTSFSLIRFIVRLINDSLPIYLCTAIGCSNPVLSAGMWQRRDPASFSDDVIIAGCRKTDKRWKLTCVGGTWTGDVIGNCSTGALGGVHTAHDIVRQCWMPWRTMSDDIGRLNDIGRCRPVSSDIVRYRNFYMLIAVPFYVSIVVATYDIVRYVNSAVKSLCSIAATSDDIVRRRPLSYDVVRSVNTALDAGKSYFVHSLIPFRQVAAAASVEVLRHYYAFIVDQQKN